MASFEWYLVTARPALVVYHTLDVRDSQLGPPMTELPQRLSATMAPSPALCGRGTRGCLLRLDRRPATPDAFHRKDTSDYESLCAQAQRKFET